MTIPLIRYAIAELLRSPPTPADQIARRVSDQIWRNEQVRHARWNARGLAAPEKRVVE